MSVVELQNGEGGVATLVIDKPGDHNRLDLPDLEEMIGLIDAAARDDNVKALVLTGAGRHFCAGASAATLTIVKDASPVEVHGKVYKSAQGVAKRIYGFPKPTVAAVSGAAITLGCEFALACDFRVIDETAFFHEAWIKRGLIPPLGGFFLLPRMIGASRAAEMILRARRVDAEEALTIGLATRLVSSGELCDCAVELAGELAALSPHSYGVAKTLLHAAMEGSIEESWMAAAMAQAMLSSGPGFKS